MKEVLEYEMQRIKELNDKKNSQASIINSFLSNDNKQESLIQSSESDLSDDSERKDEDDIQSEKSLKQNLSSLTENENCDAQIDNSSSNESARLQLDN